MDLDVIVLRSGQAGVALAAPLARDGRSVLLAKRAASEGPAPTPDCAPTKTLVGSTRAAMGTFLLDPASERILGASIVGAETGRVHPRVRCPHAGGAIVDMEEVHPRSPRGAGSGDGAAPVRAFLRRVRTSSMKEDTR